MYAFPRDDLFVYPFETPLYLFTAHRAVSSKHRKANESEIVSGKQSRYIDSLHAIFLSASAFFLVLLRHSPIIISINSIIIIVIIIIFIKLKKICWFKNNDNSENKNMLKHMLRLEFYMQSLDLKKYWNNDVCR